MTEIDELLYATAAVITENKGVRFKKQRKRKSKQPAWKERIEKEITRMRSDLSMVTELAKDNGISDRKKRKIRRRYEIKKAEDIDTEKEKLKQRIQAKAQRIRRFEKRRKQSRQNRMFKSNPKVFYRELGNKQSEINEPLSLDEIETFWKTILEDDKHHNEVADWIRKQEEMYENSPRTRVERHNYRRSYSSTSKGEQLEIPWHRQTTKFFG